MMGIQMMTMTGDTLVDLVEDLQMDLLGDLEEDLETEETHLIQTQIPQTTMICLINQATERVAWPVQEQETSKEEDLRRKEGTRQI